MLRPGEVSSDSWLVFSWVLALAASHEFDQTLGRNPASVILTLEGDVSLRPQVGNGLTREHYPHGQSDW
jgi:hypothetical protein